MRSQRWMSRVGLLVLMVGVGAGPAVAQKPPAAQNSGAAARVGDEVITFEEVKQGVKPQLAKLEEQRYEILDQRLDQHIGERLLAQEAKRRNVSVGQLLKTEVFAKAPDVPDPIFRHPAATSEVTVENSAPTAPIFERSLAKLEVTRTPSNWTRPSIKRSTGVSFPVSFPM